MNSVLNYKNATTFAATSLFSLGFLGGPAFAGSSGGTQTFYNGTSHTASFNVTSVSAGSTITYKAPQPPGFSAGESATGFIVSTPIETTIDIKFSSYLPSGAGCLYETILYYQGQVGGSDYYSVNNTAIVYPFGGDNPTCYAEAEGQEVAVPPNGAPLIGFFDIKDTK